MSKKFKGIKKMFREMEKERKKHPVYYYFHDKFWQIYNYLEMTPLNIRSFFQRGKKGWSSKDTWCFSGYLSEVIYKGLIHLKKNQVGHPCNLTEGQWIDILNKIINTFKTAQEISDGTTCYIPTKQWDEKNYKKMCEITKERNKEYKQNDRVLSKRQSKEFEEGFKLFEQHFFSLWD